MKLSAILTTIASTGALALTVTELTQTTQEASTAAIDKRSSTIKFVVNTNLVLAIGKNNPGVTIVKVIDTPTKSQKPKSSKSPDSPQPAAASSHAGQIVY
ncbi:hypothetical protein H2198_000970 [Neophaeococcomyces mojaviensis]|uniref:Uncharacterized protein n=1 Tax=Neophaeococcomyces mojaviensis TaxID=3383035 RepID=A0ACC3AIH3_9EURO|nr:hypothetical protein H2198_000970 [Knufia sp. JES_112]